MREPFAKGSGFQYIEFPKQINRHGNKWRSHKHCQRCRNCNHARGNGHCKWSKQHSLCLPHRNEAALKTARKLKKPGDPKRWIDEIVAYVEKHGG